MPASSVRILEAGDFDAIYRLLQASVAFGGAPTGPHWSLEQVREECLQGHGWICRFDSDQNSDRERVIAFILFRETGAAWEISFLATAPDARGHGRMRGLIAHMIAELPLGKEIWLEVHELNLRARQLYEKSGFRETGRRMRYYQDGGAAILYTYGSANGPRP